MDLCGTGDLYDSLSVTVPEPYAIYFIQTWITTSGSSGSYRFSCNTSIQINSATYNNDVSNESATYTFSLPGIISPTIKYVFHVWDGNQSGAGLTYNNAVLHVNYSYF